MVVCDLSAVVAVRPAPRCGAVAVHRQRAASGWWRRLSASAGREAE
ncbi:MAG: hypothetical protein ACO2PM_23095 [Pyrobaculum sp.]